MKKVLLIVCCQALLLSCMSLLSCGKRHESALGAGVSADSAAVVYYTLRAEGKYAEYVAAMQSCDSTTAAYRQQMQTLLRHHTEQVNRTRKGVRSVRALRTEMYDEGRMANVFLMIVYKDGSDEEILVPLVHDGERWRMQ